jgi:hypothetical protein
MLIDAGVTFFNVSHILVFRALTIVDTGETSRRQAVSKTQRYGNTGRHYTGTDKDVSSGYCACTHFNIHGVNTTN